MLQVSANRDVGSPRILLGAQTHAQDAAAPCAAARGSTEVERERNPNFRSKDGGALFSTGLRVLHPTPFVGAPLAPTLLDHGLRNSRSSPRFLPVHHQVSHALTRLQESYARCPIARPPLAARRIFSFGSEKGRPDPYPKVYWLRRQPRCRR